MNNMQILGVNGLWVILPVVAIVIIGFIVGGMPRARQNRVQQPRQSMMTALAVIGIVVSSALSIAVVAMDKVDIQSALILWVVATWISSGLGYFDNTENKEANQLVRFTFLVASAMLVGGFVGLLYGAKAGGIAIGLFVMFTLHWHVINVPGDMVKFATPRLFGRDSRDSGIKIYRIFRGGLKFKYPLETIEKETDVTKDILISWGLKIEYLDAVAETTGTMSLMPDETCPQQFIMTGKDDAERNKILTEAFKPAIEMLFGGYLTQKSVAEVNKDRIRTVDEMMEKHRNYFDALCRRYGVKANTVIIGNIDLDPEMEAAYKQVLVTAKINEAVDEMMKKMGYATIPDHNDPAALKAYREQWEWCHDQVMMRTKGKIGQTIEFKGLDGVSPANKERIAANVAAEQARKGGSGSGKRDQH